jgi:Ran GTPase-activating protein (RanGAP) involved in mRNA processing and transport
MLFSVLKSIPDIRVLDFTRTPLSDLDCKAIGKVLSDYKNIQELVLTECGLTVATGKDIADGIMRAKQLEVIRINNNPNLDPT